jgi:hypothetical protein
LYQKRASLLKQADVRDMFEKTFEIVWSSTVVLCFDSFSPTPSNSLAMKIPENSEDPVDSGPVAEEDIQMEYSSD